MPSRRFALLVALLAALVAAGSFAIAYRVLDQDSVAPAPPSPGAPSPPGAPAPTITEPPADTTSTTSAPFTEPGELTTPTWVVVVASGSSRADVDAIARRLAAGGYPAGVLRTDDHPSLTKGLWVAYAGPYPNSATAQSTVARLTADGFDGAYPRCVGDKKDCQVDDDTGDED